jgi:hydrophobe/amphiphile efflux-3 (HAE3) family protein
MFLGNVNLPHYTNKGKQKLVEVEDMVKNGFSKIGKFIHDHAVLTILSVIVLTIIASFGLTKIKMNMSNSMFVSSNSTLSKDTKDYQKNFDGDPFIVTIKQKDGKAVNQDTFAKIAKLSTKAEDISGITSATSIVSVLNETLAAGNSSSMSSAGSQAAQTSLMSELTREQQVTIQNELTKSLSASQQQQMSAFAQNLLTDTQKVQMATAMQKNPTVNTSDLVSKALDTAQQAKLQNYMLSILTVPQKTAMTKAVMQALPTVQKMQTATIKNLIYSDNGKVPNAMQQLLPKNGKYVLVLVATKSSSSMDDYQNQYTDLKKAMPAAGFTKSDYSVNIGGNPAISGTVGNQIMGSMKTMLISAVVIMVIILLVVFPVRKRVLPLAVVLVGMIWTFGIMGWLGIELTMATMATLPIIIGLGADFGVQFLNRYEEEYHRGETPEVTLKTTLRHIGPAVGTAVVVMIFSFLTMHLSKAPMMQDFGTTLAIGVAVCYLVELFLMFSILSLADKRKAAKVDQGVSATKGPSRLSRMLQSYSRFVMKHSLIVVAVGVVLGGIGFMFESKIPIETDMATMIPQDMPALVATNNIQDIVGSTTTITYTVKSDNVQDQKVIDYLDAFGEKEVNKYGAKKIDKVASLATTLKASGNIPSSQKQLTQAINNLTPSVKSSLINDQGTMATLTFTLDKSMGSSDASLQLMKAIQKDAKNAPNGITVKAAGGEAMLLQGMENMAANHWLIIFAGLGIIFVVLLIVYRKIRDALFPIIPIAVVLGLSPLTLHLMNVSYNPLTIALSSLVLGIGTEFTILILERYIEEKKQGIPTPEALEKAIGSVGQAITVSGLTVVAGFSTLLFVKFPVLQSFGLITVLDTAYSLICALTILPAIIYLFDRNHERKLK